MFRTIFLINSLNIHSKMGYFYAVACGRKPGVYHSWDECKEQVHQFAGAKFKKFSSFSEAELFAKGGSLVYTKNAPSSTVNTAYNSDNKRSSTSLRRPYSTISNINDKNRVPKRIKLTTTTSSSLLHTQLKLVGQNYFEVDDDGYVNVWTDGACSKNGSRSAKAGIGVFFGFDHPLNISRPVTIRSTNNYAEIKAVTEAIKEALKFKVEKLKINTDSQFLINCINKWMTKWKINGWKTVSGDPVINKDELIEMEKEMIKLKSVKWNHVRGHMGNVGNEMADKLARQGAEQ